MKKFSKIALVELTTYQFTKIGLIQFNYILLRDPLETQWEYFSEEKFFTLSFP